MFYSFTYRKTAEVLEAALRDDPFFSTMARSVSSDADEATETMVRYMDYSMVEARKYGMLYLPEDGDYGASVWSKPLDGAAALKKAAEKKAFILAHMGEDSLETYAAIVNFMSEQAARLLPDNIWYLSILGIEPALQGRGLGKRLIEPILAQADEQGMPTYLETYTPRNKSFYHRLGYRETASITEPITAADYAVMVRTAVCPSSS